METGLTYPNLIERSDTVKPCYLVSAVCLLVCVFFFFGCGPVKSTSLIVKADLALHNAKTAQADERSPYEYFAAEHYLHKAREKWSTSDFQYAIDYANRARELATKARDQSLKKDQE